MSRTNSQRSSASLLNLKVIGMSRFFFNLTSKGDTIFDEKGRDLSDLADAHRHAMLMIHKMVALDDIDWRGWSINVTDANHRSRLSVLFPQTYLPELNKRTVLHERDTVG